MRRVDPADCAGTGAHDDGVRVGAAAGEVDATQQLTRTGAGGREVDVIAAAQVLRCVDLLEAAGSNTLLTLCVIAGPWLALDSAARAAQRRRDNDALRRTTDA